MLASGYLPYEQSPIFEADASITVGTVTVTNHDSGTDSATCNVWYVPKAGSAILLTPLNLELQAGAAFDLNDPIPMQAGDRLDGKCSPGSYLGFTVRERA